MMDVGGGDVGVRQWVPSVQFNDTVFLLSKLALNNGCDVPGFCY